MKNVIVAGCAPNTGNLGVSALCRATVMGVYERKQGINATILSYGDIYEKRGYEVREGQFCTVMGVSNGKRFYKNNHYLNIYLSAKCNGLWNERAKTFLDANAVLDISGGDSFTDIYGDRRFNGIFYPKKIALENSKPLVLLPQTLGPFCKKESLEKVRYVLEKVSLAYFRDERSFEYAKEILGESFDPKRIKKGVDVAFLLEKDEGYKPKIDARIGINVSGLVYNNKPERFGIKLDYKRLLMEFIKEVCETTSENIVLVPHVVSEYSNECDYKAACDLKESLNVKYKDRVSIVEVDDNYNESMAKQVISQLEWFCGMRMHSTIAALSTCVPVVNIAYSDKSIGVFETVNQGHMVLDARVMNLKDLLVGLLDSWKIRSMTKQQLLSRVPCVMEKAEQQMNDICSFIKSAG
ncbi:polysaccharide pyruvyl transferase family protein [Neptuniibacter caesariensis]|uniref:Polysaccharide pyruvyl transferase domain-containing protein n=1 Tax=Neptuniibacter caesariensis TaxID=207954 RepID=A0A7U8C3T2_NEPCE|nr:polysaccharide pyruvyl transferase family protein [Neptuniibacter caesariensis]EAR59934.1 hypothetical protein MED92_16025 [Oceanospirillum sp. MED92] [Neptuniibacter caesariensis]